MRFLVTAGNTREKIDDVRDWGNIFTGNTGYSIARALAEWGDVDLLTSNRQHLAETESSQTTLHPMHGHAFVSHADLKALLASRMAARRYDAIFMIAAVSDYAPAGAYAVTSREPTGVTGEERWIVREVQARKVKSTHDTIAILGTRTEKLVDLFRTAWGHRGMLVKFKLEVGLSDEQLIEVGQASRRASGAEYLVANTLDMVGNTLDWVGNTLDRVGSTLDRVAGARAGGYLLSDQGAEWVPREQLPGRLCDVVRSHVGTGSDLDTREPK